MAKIAHIYMLCERFQSFSMKQFTFSFLLFFGLNVTAQQSISNITGKFAEVQRGRYSLSYPNTWTLDTSKVMGMDLLLRSPRFDSLDNFIENLNVFVQDLHGQGYNLLKMGRESENQIKSMVTDVEIIDSQIDSTSSPICYKLKYKGRHGKFNLISEQRYYLKDEVGFALTFTVQDGKEQMYSLDVKRIFDSFKLL